MRTFGNSWFKEGSLISEYAEHFGQAVRHQKNSIALDAARVDAELSSKAKSEFIANMSHELRTPLNAVIGFSDMLASGTVTSKEKSLEYAGYIKEAAEHLLALINGILDVSKIQAGKLSVDREPLALLPVIEACLLITEAKAKEKNIAIERHVSDDLPFIYADSLRLKQILINLLSNAVKFTPDWGKVLIAADIEHAGYMTITVADTGPGMTREEIETAMSPFGQLESGFNRRNEGTGLGLPIANALTKLHEGDLQVVSEKGKGTTIFIHLPLAAGSAARRFN